MLAMFFAQQPYCQDLHRSCHRACHLHEPHQLDIACNLLDRLQGAKGAKAFEKAEDPIFALENGLSIDFQHYLEHHLSQPLKRIFEPVMKNPDDLLTGKPGCLYACLRGHSLVRH